MKNGYTCGLCPGKIEWIQQYSFLVLLLLLSQPCTCSLVLLGQTLRKVIATGTELAPSFLLFLSPDWSLWFSWETQRHTRTKLSTCQQTELPWPSPTSVSDDRVLRGNSQPGLEIFKLLTGMADPAWETPSLSHFSLFFPQKQLSIRVCTCYQACYKLKLCSCESVFGATLPIAKLYLTARNITSSIF